MEEGRSVFHTAQKTVRGDGNLTKTWAEKEGHGGKGRGGRIIRWYLFLQATTGAARGTLTL